MPEAPDAGPKTRSDSLAEAFHPRRWLRLDGAYNVRELGGYATSDDRTTRWGRFVRADALHRVSRAGRARLVEYGVGTVIDLRTTRETVDQPSLFASSSEVEYLHLNLGGDTDPAGHPPPDYNPGPLAVSYGVLLDRRSDVVREVLATMARPSGKAVLFNCLGGTDRTGIIAALVLGLAGVRHELIAADYSLSAKGLFDTFAAEGRPPWMAPEQLTIDWANENLALSKTMLFMLRAIDDRHGGVEEYALGIGVTDAEIDNIKTRFVD